MPEPKKVGKLPAEFSALHTETVARGERHDCAVKAVALVTGATYGEAQVALMHAGRRPGRGTYEAQIRTALIHLGFAVKALPPAHFIQQYPGAHRNLKSVTTHHPERFPRVWGGVRAALLFSHGHVSGVVDGQLIDWARGRALRVWKVWIVTPKEQQQ